MAIYKGNINFNTAYLGSTPISQIYLGQQPLLSITPSSQWTNNIITSTGTNSASSPSFLNIWFRRTIICVVYTSAELQTAFGKSSATISGLRFNVTQQPFYQPLPSYAIGMKEGSFFGNPGFTGFTVVKSPSSESFTSGTVKTFDPFGTNFNWNGGDLAVVVAWGQCPVNYNQSGTMPIGSGTSYYSWTDSSGAWTINANSFNSTLSYRPVIQLYG